MLGGALLGFGIGLPGKVGGECGQEIGRLLSFLGGRRTAVGGLEDVFDGLGLAPCQLQGTLGQRQGLLSYQFVVEHVQGLWRGVRLFAHADHHAGFGRIKQVHRTWLQVSDQGQVDRAITETTIDTGFVDHHGGQVARVKGSLVATAGPRSRVSRFSFRFTHGVFHFRFAHHGFAHHAVRVGPIGAAAIGIGDGL